MFGLMMLEILYISTQTSVTISDVNGVSFNETCHIFQDFLG